MTLRKTFNYSQQRRCDGISQMKSWDLPYHTLGVIPGSVGLVDRITDVKSLSIRQSKRHVVVSSPSPLLIMLSVLLRSVHQYSESTS